jgi:hypothetical protein
MVLSFNDSALAPANTEFTVGLEWNEPLGIGETLRMDEKLRVESVNG